MNEFYAEEMGLDYGELCYQEQIRQSINKEILSEVLGLEILEYQIDFENELIEYWYNCAHDEIVETEDDGSIKIEDFLKSVYSR